VYVVIRTAFQTTEQGEEHLLGMAVAPLSRQHLLGMALAMRMSHPGKLNGQRMLYIYIFIHVNEVDSTVYDDRYAAWSAGNL